METASRVIRKDCLQCLLCFEEKIRALRGGPRVLIEERPQKQ
jgi:hypothetical protein